MVECKLIQVAGTVIGTLELAVKLEILLELDFRLESRLAEFVGCTESIWFGELIEQSSMMADR